MDRKYEIYITRYLFCLSIREPDKPFVITFFCDASYLLCSNVTRAKLRCNGKHTRELMLNNDVCFLFFLFLCSKLFISRATACKALQIMSV